MHDNKGRRVDDPLKAWYNEVTLLRSASSPKSFLDRALILIEQGHRRDPVVGVRKAERYDPVALRASIGEGPAFERFRDLFRMYLVQASGFRKGSEEGASKGGDDVEGAEIEAFETEVPETGDEEEQE